jgi:DNA invertase Pin-like site-specific DNA recombinase
MRVAIYARVSTDGQTVENQVRDLKRWAKNASHEIVAVYKDEGISGAKGREDRKALDELMKASVRREFDLVAAWSVDRLGRSLKGLLGLLEELEAAKVDLFLHQQALDTTSPAGRALFQMLGVFSEFERAMIRERVIAGLERAKAQGQTLGRPKVGKGMEREIARLRKEGKGILTIAREVGCGTSVVQRVVGEMSQN